MLEPCMTRIDGRQQQREDQPLLRARGLRKSYALRSSLSLVPSASAVRAVDGVDLEIRPRQTLSIVGESGCGKTTLARLILLLEKPSGGTLTVFQDDEERDVATLRGGVLRRYRAAVQSVFQDPRSSLNPRRRIRDIVAEPLLVINGLRGRELRDRVDEWLAAVGLEPALGSSFPHELSGGMLQRVAVARALAVNPRLIVLDEPTSSLDVSVQAQIMNLLKELQERFGVAYLLIAHNLAMVRYLSHRVAVMYLGQIVENAAAEALFREPLHPYTRGLISAATPPRPGMAEEEFILIGEVPSPARPPSGCRFHPRCPLAFGPCTHRAPALREVRPGHRVACHLHDPEA